MQNYNPSQDDDSIDLKKLIRRFLFMWPWFIVSLVLTLTFAKIYTVFTTETYQNTLTLLIFEEEPLLKLDNNITPAFSFPNIKMQNEIGILKSRTLTHKTLSSLDFAVEYYSSGSMTNRELYPNLWFRIEFDSIWPQAVNVPFHLFRNENGSWTISARWKTAELYSFTSQNQVGLSDEFSFRQDIEPGQWLKLPHARFRIEENAANLPDDKQQFIFYFRDINTLIERYQELAVNEIRNSSMLKLTLKGSNRTKNANFLNMHAHNFLRRELDKKNYRAQKTIDFIEEQLAIVARSLTHSESSLEYFRSAGQILDLDFQTQRSFTSLEQMQEERTRLTVKDRYYQYLQNYLEQINESGKDLIAPSSLGVDDPLLSDLIVDLMKLYTERSELLINSRRDNPILTNVEGRINNNKKTIRESLKNVMQANQMAMNDLDERINALTTRISAIPESQKHLFNFERQFNLHDNLFTFLQNKKSEIEITKSGFIPVHEIIDPAQTVEGEIVAPKTAIIYAMALFIGLLIPMTLILIYDFFNDKVRSSEDIENISSYPLLGYIATNGDKTRQLVNFSVPSLVAESFRSIRTNTSFITPPDQKPVLLITSTLLEEGKTFTSINLAASYAGMGKKTLLLSFDLRKPKLQSYMGIESESGISNFLSSLIKPEEIINPGPIENLYLGFSGKIPPNPAELLSSSRMNLLFDYARENFDVLVVDSPPVGMVSDALLLLKYSNTILYIVRQGKTPMKYLQHSLRGLKDKDVKNINLVINDVPARVGYYNAYAYPYGYFEKDK
jgi:tyrosine-protein kinase Etk/Wzc